MDALDERALSGPGTSEDVWRSWTRLASFPPLTISLAIAEDRRVVVVAPHPDDEVLGIGGILSSLSPLASRVTIVLVTAGEASYPGEPTGSCERLTHQRKAECIRGLGLLGLQQATVDFLDIPDGHVEQNEDLLSSELNRILQPSDLVFTTWQFDGHPDHDCVGYNVRRSAADLGIRVLEYPVWMWHWATPEDRRVPWHRARSFPLTAEHQKLKLAAIKEHVSQTSPAAPLQPILPSSMLHRWTRPFEIVFE